MKHCPNCNAPISRHQGFCMVCGTALQKKKKLPILYIIIGVIALIMIVSLIFVGRIIKQHGLPDTTSVIPTAQNDDETVETNQGDNTGNKETKDRETVDKSDDKNGVTVKENESTKNKKTTSIPSSLRQNTSIYGGPILDFTLEEYTPTITFSEDSTCVLLANQYEGMIEYNATYDVIVSDTGRLIKVDISDIEFWTDTTFDYFYLVEKSDGVWNYYGDTIGVTGCYSTFVGSDEQTIDIEFESVSNISVDTGLYENGYNQIELLEASNEELTFTAFWYRLTSFEETSAALYGNVAFFDYNMSGESGRHDGPGGMIIIGDDGTIALVLMGSDYPLTDGTYTYTYTSAEDKEEQIEAETQEYVLRNSSQQGWVLDSATGESEGIQGALLFYNDSTLKHVVLNSSLQGYSEEQFSYCIMGSSIFVDGTEYSILKEQTAICWLHIDTLEEDPYGISGRYRLEENAFFCDYY